MLALILLVYCHVLVLHVSSIILFPSVCRLSLCNCKHNTHVSQDLHILLSPCICMFRNDDVIVQMPCKILDDSPSEVFFLVSCESLAALRDHGVMNCHSCKCTCTRWDSWLCALFYVRTL